MKMKIIQICTVFLMFSMMSCKKEHTCSCANSIATYDAGTVQSTKSYAKKYCKNLSAGETTCKLKE